MRDRWSENITRITRDVTSAGNRNCRSYEGECSVRLLDLHGQRFNAGYGPFNDEYNKCVRKGIPRLLVIHGYGSTGMGGVWRRKLREELLPSQCDKGRLRYIRGEEIDGNRGVTWVEPVVILPSGVEFIADEILQFCKNDPRTSIWDDYIYCAFKQYDKPLVTGAIELLVRRQELFAGGHGPVTEYEVM